MYTSTENMVIHNNTKLSKPFQSKIGVKQGDILSTFILMIYLLLVIVSNLEMIQINDIYINSLLFADDLILISTSKCGLQTTLGKLHVFLFISK